MEKYINIQMKYINCILCVCRLLLAFASDNAMDDAIYALGEALQGGAIDLDAYLRVWIFSFLFSFSLICIPLDT